ncbi:hypothetical protein SNEBB_002653 [Seison nebaliae]|nr:hypothetical protein SNEBB_002653 [Seison nebaliae]
MKDENISDRFVEAIKEKLSISSQHRFLCSCDIPLNVRFRLSTLYSWKCESNLLLQTIANSNESSGEAFYNIRVGDMGMSNKKNDQIEVYAKAELLSNEMMGLNELVRVEEKEYHRLCLPIITTYKPLLTTLKSSAEFNENIIFPLTYMDLPLDAKIFIQFFSSNLTRLIDDNNEDRLSFGTLLVDVFNERHQLIQGDVEMCVKNSNEKRTSNMKETDEFDFKLNEDIQINLCRRTWNHAARQSHRHHSYDTSIRSSFDDNYLYESNNLKRAWYDALLGKSISKHAHLMKCELFKELPTNHKESGTISRIGDKINSDSIRLNKNHSINDNKNNNINDYKWTMLLHFPHFFLPSEKSINCQIFDKNISGRFKLLDVMYADQFAASSLHATNDYDSRDKNSKKFVKSYYRSMNSNSKNLFNSNDKENIMTTYNTNNNSRSIKRNKNDNYNYNRLTQNAHQRHKEDVDGMTINGSSWNDDNSERITRLQVNNLFHSTYSKKCDPLSLITNIRKVTKIVNSLNEKVDGLDKSNEMNENKISSIFPAIRLTREFVPDPTLEASAHAEKKFLLLNRSKQQRALIVTPPVKQRLTKLIAQSCFIPLTTSDKALIWQYAHHLTNDGRAVVKFLRAVIWSNEEEASSAMELVEGWKAPDVVDVLELLGSDMQTAKEARSYAVRRLREAKNEELSMFLLQLVQAIRYETKKDLLGTYLKECSIWQRYYEGKKENYDFIKQLYEERDMNDYSDLASLLIERAFVNESIAHYLFWYLHVESGASYEEDILLNGNMNIFVNLLKQDGSMSSNQSNTNPNDNDDDDDDNNENENLLKSETNTPPISLEAISGDGKLLNIFQRLKLNDEDEMHILFAVIITRLILRLHTSENGRRICRRLHEQKLFIKKLRSFRYVLKNENIRKGRQDRFALLKRLQEEQELEKFQRPVYLPIDPKLIAVGIKIDEVEVINSANIPFKLPFILNNSEQFNVLYKSGDDMRQDQLVLQIIGLVDRLLLDQGLDLKLTVYRCISTDREEGFVEFISSKALAEFPDGTLVNYINSLHDNNSNVMNNYISSCAGYGLVTYLLLVGDRNLDNILITKDGCLFHIDYGYILGHDPKIFPSPMRLTNDMVNAMGGESSENFKRFKRLCCTAFIHLRSHSNYFANALSLMLDANIHDIKSEPHVAVKRVMDKFALDKSEDDAVQMLSAAIEESRGAKFPAVFDKFHKFVKLVN